MLFKPKTQVYSALQVNWANQDRIKPFLGKVKHYDEVVLNSCLESCGEKAPFLGVVFYTGDGGRFQARHGEWILRDKCGRFSVCLPHVFAADYEPVE